MTADGEKVSLEHKTASIRGDTLYADMGGEIQRFALDEVDLVGVVRASTVTTVATVTAAVFVGLVMLSAISYEPMEIDLGGLRFKY